MNKEPSRKLQRFHFGKRLDRVNGFIGCCAANFSEGNYVSPALVCTDSVLPSNFIHPFLMKLFFHSSKRR